MNELQEYVEQLFRHQKKTAETEDLKEEILSNMMARKSDLLSQGFDEQTAVKKTKESLCSVGELIEDCQFTDVYQYRLECIQTILLNSVIFWIFSLPLMFTGHMLMSDLGLLATAVSAVLYMVKRKAEPEAASFLSISASRNRKKLVWILWCMFFLVCTLTIAALTFGSSLWFGRPLQLSGPYQFAVVATRFYLPLLTIVIPVTVGKFTTLLIKNEKRKENE